MRRFMMILGAAAIGLAMSAMCMARTLAVYPVQPTDHPPQIDGSIDDPCWAAAPPANVYYEYNKPHPGPGVLPTEFRMLYDARGIYLAIINHEEHPERLVAKIITSQNPDIWQDDCAEIYFDPAAEGIGFTSFKVNSLGMRTDHRRIDTAVSIPEWQAPDVVVAVGKTGKSWIIEAFFPWRDLGKTAEAGDLWMFDHIRFAYTSGSFQGVTWAPAGSYRNPQRFGYLYFSASAAPAGEQLASLFGRRVAPPWQMLTEHAVISCDQPGQTQTVTPDQFFNASRDRLDQAFSRAYAELEHHPAPVSRKQLDDLRHLADQWPSKARIAAQSVYLAQQAAEMARQVHDIYWQTKITQLLR